MGGLRPHLSTRFLFRRKVKYLNVKASFVDAHTVCGVSKGGEEVSTCLLGSQGPVWADPRFAQPLRCPQRSAPLGLTQHPPGAQDGPVLCDGGGEHARLPVAQAAQPGMALWDSGDLLPGDAV